MPDRFITVQDFQVNTSSVILNYRHQSICFHAYNVKNHRQRNKILVDFQTGIEQQKTMDLNTVFAIARKSKVNIMGMSQPYKPKLTKVIY